MGRTYKIKLNAETKEFYHNMFLAKKLQTWIGQYKALHALTFDDDVESFTDEYIIQCLSDKDIAKLHLSASEYEVYLQYYDEVYTKETA